MMKSLRQFVFTFTCLMTLLVSIAGTAYASSRAGASKSTASPELTVTPAENPDWPTTCEIKVTLILDHSNSIKLAGSANPDLMKDAAKSFVDVMAERNAMASVVSFWDRAATEILLTPLDSTIHVNAVKAAVDGILFYTSNANGATNWEAAFKEASESVSITSDPQKPADLVIILTDGEPTTYGYPNDLGDGAVVHDIDINHGVEGANIVKGEGTRIVAVGIGAAFDFAAIENLKRISGPDENDDYFLAGSFDQLEGKLQEIASRLCAIQVQKAASPTLIANGGSVDYSYQVTNPGDLAVGNVTIDDDVCSPVSFASGDTNGDDLLDPDETWNYTCSATLFEDTVNTVIVEGEVDGFPVTDQDEASVDVKPLIDVIKTPGSGSVTEPGGPVTFTVRVTNTSDEEATLFSLTDDVYGDLDMDTVASHSWISSACELPQPLAPGGGFYECSFTGSVAGDGGEEKEDTVTGTARDDEGNQVSDEDSAVVGILDRLPLPEDISVDKTNDADLSGEFNDTETAPAPGGTVTFKVEIRNAGAEDLSIVSISDDLHGTDSALKTDSGRTPDCADLIGDPLPAGGPTLVCYFDGVITGQFDDSETDTVTVTVEDNEENSTTQNDTSTVNTPARPTLTVTKIVENDDGGQAQVADFSLFVGDTSVASGAQNGFDPGTYQVREEGPSGYQATFGGDCDSEGNVTLEIGDEKSCTITNDDIAPTLTVIKHVINDNGGTAVASEWTMVVSRDETTLTMSDPGAESPGTTYTLLAGATYSVTETGGPSGYEQSSGGDCTAVTLDLDTDYTCTITNDDQQAYITVVKEVTNDSGGSAQPDDFNLTIDGSPVSSGVPVPVDPGTYSAGETQLPGYSFQGFSGDCDENGDITVALGESKACTLSNDDQQAYITVVKEVTNDSGGSAQPDDFNLTLDGSPVSSGVPVPVDPGTYSAGETQLPGYSFQGFSGDCDENGDITVALGESKTCTLSNTRTTGTLKIRKDVQPDDPSTTWIIDVVGATPFSDTLHGDDSTESVVVFSGSYNISETGGDGTNLNDYTSSWRCFKRVPSIVAQEVTDPSGSGTSFSIEVGPGETVTCEFTNIRKTGSLDVIKVVDDDSMWTLSYSGPASDSGDFGNGGHLGPDIVPTGTYNVSEGAAAETNGGLYNSTYACTINGQDGPTGKGRSVDVEVGQDDTVVCTFTNERKSKVTRTQGFWSTHVDVSTETWSAIDGDQDPEFCGSDVGVPQMFGGFWANIARTSDRDKRSALDQARMQLLQQLLAAMLNNEAFGSSPGLGALGDARAAFCAEDVDQILMFAGLLDEFNNSGDDLPFPAGFEAGRADPKDARDVADIPFWDELPGGSPSP
jgi:hypothetical protein